MYFDTIAQSNGFQAQAQSNKGRLEAVRSPSASAGPPMGGRAAL